MMKGSTWKGIQNARQHAKEQMQEQLQGLVTLGLILGVGALALSALGGSGA